MEASLNCIKCDIEEMKKITEQKADKEQRKGKKSSEVRPIIARFLPFQDREFIFNKARMGVFILNFACCVVPTFNTQK